MNRQEYNRKIHAYLFNNKEFTDKLESVDPDLTFLNTLYLLIEDYPQQRFGQIMCNYMIPDYRNPNPSATTLWLQEYLFPDNPDPFFEESKYTYYRLTKEIPEPYKKELEEKKGKKVYYASGDNTKVGTLEGLAIDCTGEWCWIIDGSGVSTSKSITLL